MQIINSSSNKKVKLILYFIILIIVVSGLSNFVISNNEPYIAIVNGEKILKKQFDYIYNIEIQKQKNFFGKDFDKIKNNFYYIKQIKQQILNKLVNELILIQYANKFKINVSDSKIKQIILSEPMFQKKGKFDSKKQLLILEEAGISLKDYIKEIRKKIITENFINMIEKTEFTFDNNVENYIKYITEERTVEKLILNKKNYNKKIKITDKNIKLFYKKHNNIFNIPERIKIQYKKINMYEINKYYTLTKNTFDKIIDKNIKFDINIDKITKKKINNKISKFNITPWFNKNYLIDRIKFIKSEKIKNYIFEILIKEKSKNYKIIPINNNQVLILKIYDYKPKHKKNIEENKKDIISHLKNLLIEKNTIIQAYKIINQLKENKNQLLNKFKLKFNKQETFKRNSENYINKIVFSMNNFNNKKNKYKVIKDLKGNITILKLKYKKFHKIKKEQKEIIAQNIIKNDIESIFYALINSLKNQSKIEFINNN
ncbi:SurA N-terminal domain-containing protein [Buchnera aphidicola]|uniref:SurA N-terminal domain-containing protein n=1 Tax=Buchnera aphidicola TaxID=9 RepID=UPI003464E51C